MNQNDGTLLMISAPIPFNPSPRHTWLDLDPALVDSAWVQSQRCSKPWARWNVYLNAICAQTFLAWLQDERGLQGNLWPNPQALSYWGELVNGIAVSVEDRRFVLIPFERLEPACVYVAKEWVDIGEWQADYYLAANLNIEEGWMEILGYTTHQILKEKGRYDPEERQYCLDVDELIPDLNVLWLAQQYCPEQILRSAVDEPSVTLSITHARNLIERLSKPNLTWPRLSLPFEQWAAILANSGWRQQLCDRRQGIPEQWSAVEWVRSGISEMAQQLGWRQMTMRPAVVKSLEPQDKMVLLSHSLTIAGRSYELRVVPKASPHQGIWKFELRSAVAGGLIPGGFQLTLLTEDLQPFENNQVTATAAMEVLELLVKVEFGEGLVWETSPLPDNFSQQPLYF
jgi:Protein of unknown function (DUF1822)